MIRPNVETFIGCESSFEEASVVLYGAQAFDRVPDLVRQPCAMKALALRPTVPIRTETLWISGYLTAEIWSFALEAVKWLFWI